MHRHKYGKIIFSILSIIFFCNNIDAQNTKPCLFIGTYDKEKKGICSDKTWIHEEINNLSDYEQRRLIFREAHKNDESFSTSTKFVSAKQCVIVFEYRKKISGWDCKPTEISYITGASIESCKEQLAALIAKSPHYYITQPNIIFSREASINKQVVENNPDKESSGDNKIGGEERISNGSSTSSKNEGSLNENKNKPCPTFGFKFSNNNPSYNCVALDWWAMSTKTNMVDACGNFKQSTDPQAKSFSIEFRKQGDIYWTIEKRENSGKNTHAISGLDACTNYEVRLITTCDNNQVSAPTNTIRFTTACNKPGNLTIENITNNSAKINNMRLTAAFTYPCSSQASTQILIIEFKTNNGSWQQVICNPGSPCFLNALSAGTIYKVRARFKYGYNLFSDYTNEISFTTDNGTKQFNQSNSNNSSEFDNSKKPQFDPELLALIEEHNVALKLGQLDEVNRLKRTILEIAEHAYPDQLEEIKSLLNKSQIKDKFIETANSNLYTTSTDLTNPIKKTEPIITTNSNIIKPTAKKTDTEYSDWLTIKNPYHDMQVRYKLEKQEGEIGYYKTQFRIDFESKSRCLDQRCLGFVLCFGYPTPDEKEFIYLHYKIYNSFKEIYTMPNLIPIKLSIDNGYNYKRMLKQDGFYFITKDNPQPTYIAYFDKSVDYILSGSPIQCKNFIESKAIILK